MALFYFQEIIGCLASIRPCFDLQNLFSSLLVKLEVVHQSDKGGESEDNVQPLEDNMQEQT